MRKLVLAAGLLAILSSSTWAVTARQQMDRLLVLNALLFDLKLDGIDPEFRSSLGVDFINQPPINTRVGDQYEKDNRPFAVPRPRAKFWLGNHLLGAAYIPPLKVSGNRASIGSLEYGVLLGLRKVKWIPSWLKPVHFLLRTTITSGKIVGQIASATQDDTLTFELSTYDGTIGYTVGHHFIIYSGFGGGRLNSSILVAEDGAFIEVENEKFQYLFAGISYRDKGFLYSFQQDFHAQLRNFSFSVGWVF